MKKRIRQKKQKSDLWVAVGSVAAIIILAVVIINLDNLFPGPQSNITYQEAPDVYATVNGIEISGAEIEDKYSRVQEEYKAFVTKSMILNQTIYEHLFVEDLQKKGIVISDERIEALIDKRLKETIDVIGQEEFNNMLAAQGTSVQEIKEMYWDSFRLEIILEEMNAQFITEDDLKDYYDQNQEMFITPEMINTNHILICFANTTGCNSNITEADALVQITDIRNQILAGASFEAIATEHSTCPSGSRGGLLGNSSKGQFVKAFDDLAWSLELDEISEPVKTEFGYHIIRLNERIPSQVVSFEDAKDQISSMVLIEKQQEMQEYYDTLYAAADIRIYFKEVDSSCSGTYGIGQDTVIFYHTDTCPHCQRMSPIVKDLESLGLSFYWANPAQADTVEIIKGCYPDQLGKGVPQFICAGTGKVLLGERSKDVLEQFVNECRGV